MADVKTTKVSVTNAGRGPRTFFQANGEAVILRPGEKFEGEVSDAEKRDFSADLVGGDVDVEAMDTSGNTNDPFAFPSLDGLNRDQLLEVARNEGYPVLGDDANEDDLRAAIEASREASSNALKSAMEPLRAKSAKDLRAMATKDGVDFETDDNKADLVLKIAQAQVAKGE